MREPAGTAAGKPRLAPVDYLLSLTAASVCSLFLHVQTARREKGAVKCLISYYMCVVIEQFSILNGLDFWK